MKFSRVRPLEEMRAYALRRIALNASAQMQQVVDLGRLTFYQLKASEARATLNGQPSALIEQEAHLRGMSATELASQILAENETANRLLAEIELERVRQQLAVRSAQTREEINQELGR